MHRDALSTAEDLGANTVSPWIELDEEPLGAFGVFVNFAASGKYLYAGTAEGLVRVRSAAGDAGGSIRLDGSPLCVAALSDDDLLVGTDAGRVSRVSPEGLLSEFFDAGSVWIEQLATGAGEDIAVAAGRSVRILDGRGGVKLDLGLQPSTPTGLAFDSSAERLAVAHYGGVSVWHLGTGKKESTLQWHGSHTLMEWSPDGRHIATATQDKELHAWRMPEGKSLKMSGYPGKIRSLSWTPDGAYLACSGADTITCWQFRDGGPTGTAPLEFGYVFDSLVSRVAAHPRRPFVAGGYDNGSILVGALSNADALIARPGSGGRITAMAWSPLTDTLAAMDEGGTLSLMCMQEAGFE